MYICLGTLLAIALLSGLWGAKAPTGLYNRMDREAVGRMVMGCAIMAFCLTRVDMPWGAVGVFLTPFVFAFSLVAGNKIRHGRKMVVLIIQPAESGQTADLETTVRPAMLNYGARLVVGVTSNPAVMAPPKRKAEVLARLNQLGYKALRDFEAKS